MPQILFIKRIFRLTSIFVLLGLQVLIAAQVKVTYQLPEVAGVYRVTIAIVKADDPNWIVSTMLSGAAREVNATNGGIFTDIWDGLDDDGVAVEPGEYTWKGVCMPAAVWPVDGEYHSFTAKLAVAAGSTIHPQPSEDTMSMIFQGVSTLPVSDVSAMSNGDLLFCGEYIENGTNPLRIDPAISTGTAQQLVWGSPSGGVGGVMSVTSNEDYAYAVSNQGTNDFITRYSVADGSRLNFGSDAGIYISNVCLLPLAPGGGRETAVSMASQKVSSSHYLYVPLLRSDKLIVLDGANAGSITEVTGLVSPRGVRLNPNSPQLSLYILCKGISGTPGGFVVAEVGLTNGLPNNSVTVAATLQGLDAISLAAMGEPLDRVWNSDRVAWNIVSKAWQAWAGKLQAASGLAVDKDGNFYVGDQIANQVRKYSSTGTLLGTIGAAGGQQAGVFNPDAMHCPQGIDVWYDGSNVGHLVVSERVTWQRVSQWSLSGSFEKDWYVSAYGFPAAVDPANPEDVYVCGGDWPGTVRYKVNYSTGAWYIDAVWPLQHGTMGDTLMWGLGVTAGYHVYNIDSHTFLVAHGGQNAKYVYEVDGYNLIPKSALAPYLLQEDADRLGIDLTGVLTRTWNVGFGTTTVYIKPWTWRDANGDGVDQLSEMDFSEPSIPGYSGPEAALVCRSYYSQYYDENLNLVMPDITRADTMIIPRQGWDGQGNPIYSWADLRVLYTDDVLGAMSVEDQRKTFQGTTKGPDGSFYSVICHGPALSGLPTNIDHGKDHTYTKVMKFESDGQGGYDMAWRVGQHATNIAQPGKLYAPAMVSEPINGIIGVHEINGTFHLFTTDGLYLDTILNDRYAHGFPRTAYDLDGEMFGGRMFYNADDGQAYLMQGHKGISIFRIENLTTADFVMPVEYLPPSWGSDFDKNGIVDMSDLAYFALHWLEQVEFGDIHTRWDSDFNADTVDSAPSVELFPNGFPEGVTLTKPQENTGGGTDGDTVLVQSSAGNLTDQPVVLTIPIGNDNPTNLTYADWDGDMFDFGDTHFRLEWDMSIISSPSQAGAVIIARLDGFGFGPSMINWGLDGTGGAGGVGIVYGEGAPFTNWLPWAFNTPMHMKIELDTVNDLYSVYKDGAVIVEDVSVPGIDTVFALSLKSAHGGVGTGAGGVVAVDNFKATVVSLPQTCAEVWAAGQGMAADLTGPGGVPDCVVNLLDFAEFANWWLVSNDPPQ